MNSQQQMDPETQRELQEMLQVENQKAELTQHVQGLTTKCWEVCIGKPGAKMSSSEKSCLENCVGRFLDTTVFIINRSQKMGKQ